MTSTPNPNSVSYSYLGPAGTFAEAALKQVPEAAGAHWKSVNNVGEALDDVTSGRSIAVMIAIENSIEGGVSATQDALTNVPNLRIIGEYLLPVNFVLITRPGMALADVKVVTAHPVAYAQTRRWLDANLPSHGYVLASSNVAATATLLDTPRRRMPQWPHPASPSATTSMLWQPGRQQPERGHPLRSCGLMRRVARAHGCRQDEHDH